MNLSNSFSAIFVLNLLAITCFALPSQKLQLALNLHQNLSPHDINGLTKEQRVKAALDVESTIEEVQKLLALDPTLPRLTKGEIQDLFEKATRAELEKSILNGDNEKRQHMSHLLHALPFQKKEIATLEKLSKVIVTTEVPKIEPEIPKELKKLLRQYGLLDKDGNPIEIAPLPIALVANNDPKSTLHFNDDKASSLLDKYRERVKTPSFLIKAEDYETFKPLKVAKSNSTALEVDSILKQFGLSGVGDKNTAAKKVKLNNKPSKSQTTNDASYLLAGYSSLLENIGIQTPKNDKLIGSTRNSNKNKNRGNNEDFKNLQHLLETIKELEKLNSTLTVKEVEKLNLKNYNFSDSLLKNGPDPLLYQNNFSALKNEVKRRQTGIGGDLTPLLESSLESNDDDDTSDAPTTKKPAATTTTTTTTTERTTTESSDDVESSTQEKKNTLEDEIEPIEDPEPLPPPRRSGFYMLVDWNSFFEVGEDDKIKVRFDPKIGDPSRFLPVNIP